MNSAIVKGREEQKRVEKEMREREKGKSKNVYIILYDCTWLDFIVSFSSENGLHSRDDISQPLFISLFIRSYFL